jgi:hypothetical protein
MIQAISHRCKVHFTLGRAGHRQLKAGEAPAVPQPGRVPLISRWMALAIRFEGLIRDGKMKDYAEIARLGHVSRARLTQIMNLLNLAPDIQEEILFLPRSEKGRDLIKERDLRPICRVADWSKQRKMWKAITPPPFAHRLEKNGWLSWTLDRMGHLLLINGVSEGNA